MLILEFVVGMAALVVVHELGHYLVCKLFRIPVDEFGIGLPPRITKLFEWDGTQFTLNTIPLGGFVRIRGETDPSVPEGLMGANPWKRIAVYFAGPFMNLMVAVILYTLIFMRLGMDDPTRLDVVMISRVDEGSPAEAAGLQPGDIILQAEGVTVDESMKLRGVVYENLGQPIALEVLRGEQSIQLTLTPRAEPPEGQGPIGIVMGPPTVPVSLWQALPAGVSTTYRHGQALIGLITNFVRGRDTGEGRLLGLKGMADTYSSIREGDSATGLPQDIDIMGFFTNLTISLGLLNLLPIPVLDGGRIFLVLPEIILRRRIPPRYQEILIGVTFLLLIGLLVLVNVLEFF